MIGCCIASTTDELLSRMKIVEALSPKEVMSCDRRTSIGSVRKISEDLEEKKLSHAVQ